MSPPDNCNPTVTDQGSVLTQICRHNNKDAVRFVASYPEVVVMTYYKITTVNRVMRSAVFNINKLSA